MLKCKIYTHTHTQIEKLLTPKQQSKSGYTATSYNTLLSAAAVVAAAAAAAAAQIPFFVDDPLYVNGSQYYADLINATGAWNLATGK